MTVLSDLRNAATRHPGPANAAFLMVGAFLAGFAAIGSGRVVAYTIVFVVVASLVARADRHAQLSNGVWWGFAALTLLHFCGGLLPSPDTAAPVLYETWLIEHTVKFDQAVHLFGTALVTVGLWQLHGRLGTAWLGAVAIGFGNEVVEMMLARTFPTQVGDLQNGLWDVVFNVTGATLALLALAERPAQPQEAV